MTYHRPGIYIYSLGIKPKIQSENYLNYLFIYILEKGDYLNWSIGTIPPMRAPRVDHDS